MARNYRRLAVAVAALVAVPAGATPPARALAATTAPAGSTGVPPALPDDAAAWSGRRLVPDGTFDRLWVKADVSAGGSVRVEVLDPDGSVLPGYSRDDSTVLTGDALRTPATWAVKQLPGGDIRLRIVAADADVYSFGAAA